MTVMQKTFSPIDGRLYAQRHYASTAQIEAVLVRAARAQADWKHIPLSQRAAICTRFVDAFIAKSEQIVPELSWQMGRPICAAPAEVRGFEERARYMIEIAPSALKDVPVGPKPGFRRFIRREPLGVVLTIAAWNYPYLIAVNSVVPAIMAGNAVVLKHSSQTPLCAERLADAFGEAGLPPRRFPGAAHGSPPNRTRDTG